MFTAPPNSNIFQQTPNNNYDNLQIYPTVANETIQVSFAKDATIRLVSLSGQIIQVIPHAGNRTTLEVGTLNEGLYLVQVHSGQKIETRKIIVSH